MLRICVLLILLPLLFSACVPSIVQETVSGLKRPLDATPTPARAVGMDRPERPSAAVEPARPTGTATPSTTPEPTPTTPADELARLDAAQRLPQNRVLLARALSGQPDAPLVARTAPLDVQVGHTREFWVNSIVNNHNYTITAELRYAGPVVLMYVEHGADVIQASLEEAATAFEQQIYPRTRELFGSEWQPGVDGDSRIVILNARTMEGGVAGYFSPRDSVPNSVNRFSNEHEMFYMNVGALRPGSTAYLDTLAHEFQHMIHWNEQRQSATWFNEGNSTLSEDLNGFVGQHFVSTYLSDPDTQLTAWSELPGSSIAHYGASHLFMRYIYAHYTDEAGLKELIRANAGNNLHAFVKLARQTRPDMTNFGDLFADWAVANLLNEPDLDAGQYAYNAARIGLELLPRTVRPDPLLPGSTALHVNQFGADYLALPTGAHTLHFTGSTSVELVGAMPRGTYAWWSGRGDNSVAHLTRSFDLRGLESATLRFDAWYELEQYYDYAFVTVSTDGGAGWHILPGSHTTTEDPHGANYGHGFTGVSGLPGQPTSIEERGQWVQAEVDLTPYVGQQVQVRFWQINDEGFNAPGMLLDNIRIPEAGYADAVEAGRAGWQSSGFVRVDGDLAQSWHLRLVRTAADGSVNVEEVLVDEQGRAAVRLEQDQSGVLVVAATTPHTTEPARYTVLVE